MITKNSTFFPQFLEENIQKRLHDVIDKVKRENGNKVNDPEVLAPALWERMKSAKKRNRTYEDILEF